MGFSKVRNRKFNSEGSKSGGKNFIYHGVSLEFPAFAKASAVKARSVKNSVATLRQGKAQDF